MVIQELAEWLRCPLCGDDLSPHLALTLSCRNGHSFDVNKRGYVSLLGPKPMFRGDTAAMLDSRDLFLDAGHYQPVREALVESLRAHFTVAPTDGRSPRIVDAGCGTGYYVEGVLALIPDAHTLGFDVSPLAVQRTVRRTQGACSGLVADTWAPIPLRSGVAEALYTVFAPRNLPEFHRALAPGGTLIVIVPTARHLQELRAVAGQALDVPADKAERLVADGAQLFTHCETTSLEYAIELRSSESAELVRMGPAGHHRSEEQLRAVPSVSATVSIDVVRFMKR